MKGLKEWIHDLLVHARGSYIQDDFFKKKSIYNSPSCPHGGGSAVEPMAPRRRGTWYTFLTFDTPTHLHSPCRLYAVVPRNKISDTLFGRGGVWAPEMGVRHTRERET